MNPFDSRIIEGGMFVCVPENMAQLVENNYLVTLWALAVEKLEANVVLSSKKVTVPAFMEEHTKFLHGFGLHLANGKGMLPLVEEARGPFKRGLLVATRHIVGKLVGVDSRWFKFGTVSNVFHELYGDAWATGHLFEKKLLDFVLSALGHIAVNEHINSYLLSVEEVKKITGLKSTRHKNKVLSILEQQVFEHDYRDYLKFVQEFRMPTFGSSDHIAAFQKDVQIRQRDGKKYKEAVERVTQPRIKLIYTSKNKRENLKKVPIEDLIKRHKGSVEYINAFSPCAALGITPAFTIGRVPSNDEEATVVKEQLKTWAAARGGLGLTKDRVQTIVTYFLTEMSL
jgi:hypothetical protein